MQDFPEVKDTLNKKALVRGYADGAFDLPHSGHYNAIR
jgi:glycerol-3-phosphate cytidylyltransferase-like family protein